ncbi:MAG TPA: hypothetical protein VM364_13590, partial [Vicinamibacterales bacterium]|nr:hypothetical protein [Vicinamibacterales bacterium]
SYRAASSMEEALAQLERGAGTHFDPAIVEAVLRLHARGELLPPDWEALTAPGDLPQAMSER